jgi:hypothetical protein
LLFVVDTSFTAALTVGVTVAVALAV